MTERTSRRWFLGATVAVGGLAGCIGGDGDGDGDGGTGGTDGSDGGSDGSSDGESDGSGGGSDGSDGETGGEETPEDTPTPTPEETPTPTPEATPTPGDGGGGGGSDYRFSEGESYTYDSIMFEQEATSSWSVVEASENEVTVALEQTTEEETKSEEITKPQEKVFDQIAVAPGGLTFGVLRSLRMLVGDHSLEQGEEWTTPTADAEAGSFGWQVDEVTLEVTGTNSYAGVECTTLEMRTPDEGKPMGELCVDPDLAFPVWSVAFDEEGEEAWEFTLTDYSEGSG